MADKYINAYAADEMLSRLSGMYHIEDIRAMLARLPADEPKSSWISVKDKLPEDPLQTIIVTDGNQVCVAVYSVVYGEFSVMCGRDTAFSVTHWMPLPEPPKENI